MSKCYNGCWDSQTQARFDEENNLFQKLRKHEPEAWCTYFPIEEKYHVHVWGRSSSSMYDSRLAALTEALNTYKKED